MIKMLPEYIFLSGVIFFVFEHMCFFSCTTGLHMGSLTCHHHHTIKLMPYKALVPLRFFVETNKIDGKFYRVGVQWRPRLFVPPIDGSI